MIAPVRALAPLLVSLLLACAAKSSPHGDAGSGAPARAAASEADFSWSSPLAAGAAVHVHGIDGNVTVVPADGDTLTVRGHKSGHGDLDAVQVRVVEAGDRIVICSVFPGTRCEADGLHGSTRGAHSVQVDLVLELPTGAGLTARTVNGSIVADGVTGALDAHTVNGNLELSARGEVIGKTVNGSITARLSAPLRGAISLRTVNGAVSVSMPAAIDAELSASAVNGSIESTFALVRGGGPVGGRASGRLGRGGPSLELGTVNGSIRIEMMDAA